MKIVTVNIPESYINAMEKLIGRNGLYPSRSELIRSAVREFLKKELKLAADMAKYQKEDEKDKSFDNFDDENFVRVPTITENEAGEPVREYNVYKIVKRLV